MITRQIPASKHYPGLIAHDLGNNREIVVMGSGKIAEQALSKAVKERGK
jgi:hypothetical protein